MVENSQKGIFKLSLCYLWKIVYQCFVGELYNSLSAVLAMGSVIVSAVKIERLISEVYMTNTVSLHSLLPNTMRKTGLTYQVQDEVFEGCVSLKVSVILF